ncbi:MAG: hydrogenase accessory protein [Pseudomonadota bacterium]
MIAETDSIAINDMLDTGLLTALDADSIGTFAAQERPQVLFFPGPKAVRREAHDVAVALREVLRDYGGGVHGGVVRDESAAALSERFRVSATPSLVLLYGNDVLEVLPRVRDWAEYAEAFQRYFGPASRPLNTGAQA